MYFFWGSKRRLIWALLGVLLAISISADLLHQSGIVTARSATLSVYAWTILSFTFIAALILWREPDYVSRFFDVIPVAEMKRAYLGLGGLVTFAALSSGMARQEGFMPIAQFVASASGIFVLPDWLAAVRSHRRSRRKG
ncbi:MULTISPECIES: hypothetical protein [Sinorhizobium/Ensifer group]|uniref:hypothetical protein n=1 Tax=Sinorhizobium/Ensifer group TaxID=227292 RepID=UPI0007091BDF|nr:MULTISPECIES: hypothetical protein [Sinorhizobium/Ensifer group]KRD53303.1 hypothetical protein ASE60_12865 [Ensifer sp. Root278]KSV89748.1 hypothetical protein N184_27025 [Sinorhizobium sp. GL28]